MSAMNARVGECFGHCSSLVTQATLGLYGGGDEILPWLFLRFEHNLHNGPFIRTLHKLAMALHMNQSQRLQLVIFISLCFFIAEITGNATTFILLAQPSVLTVVN